MQRDSLYADRADRPVAEIMLGPKGLVRIVNMAMLAVFALLAVVVIDWVRADTTLITPISSRLWTYCLIGGCLTGLAMAGSMAVLAWFQKGLKGRSIGVTASAFLIFSLVFTPVFALASVRVAWRIAEIRAFAEATAPMLSAKYREQSYGHTDGGEPRYYVNIDPFRAGSASRVWMPGVDYRRLVSADRQGLAYGFCAKVMEQRAGQAVRIRIDQIDDSSPTQLIWCPTHVFGD